MSSNGFGRATTNGSLHKRIISCTFRYPVRWFSKKKKKKKIEAFYVVSVLVNFIKGG